MKEKKLVELKIGLILDGEVYKAFESEGYCVNCAFLLEKESICRPLCRAFEDAGLFKNCAFKNVENNMKSEEKI